VRASRRWWIGTGALLAAAAFLTRLPGLVSDRLFNVDEAYLAAMGMTMGRGGQLYVDVVDRKPPVLPWLYALSEWAVGAVDLRLLRVLATLAVAGAGLVVVALVRRLGGSPSGAATAGVLLVLGTAAFPPADGQAANFELFALLPASAAVLAAVGGRGRARPSRLALLALAGALVGVAGMIKQPFLVMLAPVAWEVWRGRPRLAGGAAALAGAATSSLVIGLPFGLGEVWRWAWVDTGDYLDGQVGGLRILGVLAVVAAGLAVLQAPLLASVWLGRSRLRAVDLVVWAWLAASLLAVVPGFRFIVHYFLLLVPPLAVVAGLALSDVPVRARRAVLAGSVVVAGACVAVAALPVADRSRVPADMVLAIQERVGPDDRIMVWGALPELYWRTQRLPGARFLSAGYVNGKWADRQVPPERPEELEPYRRRWPIFNQDLVTHRPRVVVDMSTSTIDGWDAYPPGRYSFGRLLEACYEPFGDFDGMTLWELADEACLDQATPTA
jgi:4-amino-4-deoxy-L-arabinose transferase-like glycosyltransferase